MFFSSYFTTNDICTDSVKWLWYFCLHPVFDSKFATFYTFMNVMICVLYTALAIKGISVSYNTDLSFLTENIQTCILMAHVSNVLCRSYNNAKNYILDWRQFLNLAHQTTRYTQFAWTKTTVLENNWLRRTIVSRKKFKEF